MIIGISEMKWKDDGERSTDYGHKVYYSGPAGKHEHSFGFIVNSTVSNSGMLMLLFMLMFVQLHLIGSHAITG